MSQERQWVHNRIHAKPYANTHTHAHADEGACGADEGACGADAAEETEERASLHADARSSAVSQSERLSRSERLSAETGQRASFSGETGERERGGMEIHLPAPLGTGGGKKVMEAAAKEIGGSSLGWRNSEPHGGGAVRGRGGVRGRGAAVLRPDSGWRNTEADGEGGGKVGEELKPPEHIRNKKGGKVRGSIRTSKCVRGVVDDDDDWIEETDLAGPEGEGEEEEEEEGEGEGEGAQDSEWWAEEEAEEAAAAAAADNAQDIVGVEKEEEDEGEHGVREGGERQRARARGGGGGGGGHKARMCKGGMTVRHRWDKSGRPSLTYADVC